VPPLAVFGFELIGGDNARGFARRLGVAMLAADIAIALILLRTWGRGAAFRYWVIGTPLCLFIYLRVDLLSVLLAVIAVAVVKKRHIASGPLLAAAVFVKVWPIILLPLLWIERAWKAVLACLATVALGVMAWVWWGGSDGPIQVLTFRHSNGFEFQSPIGFLIWQLGRGQLRDQGGSERIGSAPLAVMASLTLIIVVLAGWAWFRTANDRPTAEGLGSAVAVAALLVFSPVGSHQYLAWLLPWVAIADRARLRDWTFIATMSAVATALYAGRPIPYSYWIDVAALGVRNFALVVVLIAGLAEVRRQGHASASDPARLAADVS
jgi:Glycosyltransferase family 87